jgi:hypothetical protein
MSIKQALQLPLYKDMPWPEEALMVKPTRSNNTRSTIKSFKCKFVEWEGFAEAANAFWDGVNFDGAEKFWKDRLRTNMCYDWSNMHNNTGEHSLLNAIFCLVLLTSTLAVFWFGKQLPGTCSEDLRVIQMLFSRALMTVLTDEASTEGNPFCSNFV